MWINYLILTFCILFVCFKKTTFSNHVLQFYIKYILFYTSIVCSASLFWPLFLRKPRNVDNIKLLQPIAQSVSKIIEIDWEIRDSKYLNQNQGAVIVSNHQSSLELLGIIRLTDIIDKLTCVSKKELLYMWPFGLAAYLAGLIFIDRNNPKNAYRTLNKISTAITNDRYKIWIYPEGTRNHNEEFLPFKKGAFTLAIRAQVPIIPIVFSPFYFIDIEKRMFNKGHMIIKCLEEISTIGMTESDIPAVLDIVRDNMSKAYKELKKEVLLFHTET